VSTRGFLGFVIDGEVKITYNHHDSYPDYLGLNVLHFAKAMDRTAAGDAARALRVVDGETSPTDEEAVQLAPFTDRSVGGPSDTVTWYQALRRTQSDPGAILAAGYMLDGSDFPADSLFAEHGYVIDFDGGTLEAYQGFQEEPHAEGRFAAQTPCREDYFPVKLIKTWPLDALPSDHVFCTEAVEDDDQ
jgi:hypothetical protein